MAVIAMTREMATLGKDVASGLAERLDFLLQIAGFHGRSFQAASASVSMPELSGGPVISRALLAKVK